MKGFKIYIFRIRMKHSLLICCTWKWFSKILILCLLGSCLPSISEAKLVDKVVAVVNDDVITLSEVEEEAAIIYQSMSKQTSGQTPTNLMAEAHDAALNGLIDRRLINQRAKLTNTTVTDEELTNAFESTRNRNGLDPVEFRKKLELSGMTEETFKKQLRDQVLQSKLVSYDVRSKIVVTDEMVRDDYNKHYTAKAEKGSFYLLQMGFQWNPKIEEPEKLLKEKADTKKRAERALDLVHKGQDFKEVAKKFSDLPSAVDGGDLGILQIDDMARTMREAIVHLQPGDISKIIDISNSYQIFKLLPTKDVVALSASSFDKVKEEIREKLYDEKLKAAYAEWVKKLKESAYIQKL